MEESYLSLFEKHLQTTNTTLENLKDPIRPYRTQICDIHSRISETYQNGNLPLTRKLYKDLKVILDSDKLNELCKEIEDTKKNHETFTALFYDKNSGKLRELSTDVFNGKTNRTLSVFNGLRSMPETYSAVIHFPNFVKEMTNDCNDYFEHEQIMARSY
ncbi:MAG: hypothetical protein V1870_03130 [Candidatus Aenigmatarchaeota archaeon]